MSLIERLTGALSADYDIEREVAGGGMGVVFAGRQRRLDRRVAIKILRPELATGIAAERFLAEGRLLARLSHSRIVPVYDAGESDGLLYYVMEFIEGETLAERLRRGPLPPAEVRALAEDLLGALAAAHAHGVVHRDVKPQNIFLRDRQALLGDFGIAHWREGTDGTLTVPGQLLGTPQYMSPEQREGEECTPGTDVYAAGLVLYEASTGGRWPPYQDPAHGDWTRVPAFLRAPLRRALEVAPAGRWRDAESFAGAVAAPSWGRWPLIGVAVVLLVLAGWRLWSTSVGSTPIARGGVTIAVEPFRMEGGGADAELADSVWREFRATLAGYPDFYVPLNEGTGTASADVHVTGKVGVTDAGIRVTTSLGARGEVQSDTGTLGPKAQWELVAHLAAANLARAMFQRSDALEYSLPASAVPSTGRGFDLWLRAEQYLAQARWDEARTDYVLAEREDPDCYLCLYRLYEVERWLAEPHDPMRMARLEQGIGRFPEHYQSLVRAAFTALPARLDTLQRAVDQRPKFFLAQFESGDELFHRGPLYGRLRSEALEPLQQAVLLRPRFGPGWEHLTWLRLSEADSALAGAALDSLNNIPGSSTGFSQSMRVMLELGYRWRFFPPALARDFSRQVLAMPGLSAQPDAAAGARLMMTADAPRGAVELGGLLAQVWPDRPDAARGGRLGMVFGYAALGRLDSVRVTGAELAKTTSDPGYGLVALEVEALLRAFDPDTTLRRAPDLQQALRVYLQPGAYSDPLRMRAAWAAGMLAIRSGDSVAFHAARDLVPAGTLRQILDAMLLGARDDPRGALQILATQPVLGEPGGVFADPVQDGAVHFLRAEQFERIDEVRNARDQLIWYQHNQIEGHLISPPQPGEIAWAAGTLARWRLTQILGPNTASPERCAALRAVARLWIEGSEPFRSRALAARQAGGACSR